MSDFLDSIAADTRPEPNAEGSFDCMTCDVTVETAHYDRVERKLRWWCPDGHESLIKDIDL